MTTDDLLPKRDVVELIAKKLACSERHASERIMRRSDFPKPRKQAGRLMAFARQDIERWLLVN